MTSKINGAREELRVRTPYGERLYIARTQAKMTQKLLAKAGGIAQSTLGELEYYGDGSSATVRMAMACGVRPEWLSEGTGPMREESAWPFKRVDLSRVLALEPTQLSYVEGRLEEALNNAIVPSPDDISRFRTGHQAKGKPVVKRRAA